MIKIDSRLKEKIDKGEKFFIAEIQPPMHGNAKAFREDLKNYKGKVIAFGINDNRTQVGMSALAAASIAISEKLEPILHMITRDRNRIALISDILGAEALGIVNLLITSGEHHTLGNYKKAKRVFDIDSIQLLKTASTLSHDANLVDEKKIPLNPFYLGAAVDPYADPVDLQMIRLNKKILAGANYVITKPVFDIDRFKTWLDKINEHGIDKKIAIIAGIRVFKNAEHVETLAKTRPNPMVPDELIKRMKSKSKETDQRKEGLNIAMEIIQKLSSLKAVKGFQISGEDDHEGLLEIIEKSGLGG